MSAVIALEQGDDEQAGSLFVESLGSCAPGSDTGTALPSAWQDWQASPIWRAIADGRPASAEPQRY